MHNRSIAIMQPYVFPYIGYFQLIKATDLFVFYDDVNFIKKGWINRNRILVNGQDHLITVPCEAVSQNKLINEIYVGKSAKEYAKILTTIDAAYKKAPYYSDVMPMIELTVNAGHELISELAIASVVNVCNYLGLQKHFKNSSVAYDNRHLKKADRLIDITKTENFTNYINPIGGAEIYTKEYYTDQGVSLQFLKPGAITYNQFKPEFVPWLSVIDVLMFNSKDEVMQMLDNYELI